MSPIELDAAKNQLPQLITAALNGEEVVLINSERQLVQLTPVPASSPSPGRKFGSARGKISMTDDFDAPLEDFREYMQ